MEEESEADAIAASEDVVVLADAKSKNRHLSVKFRALDVMENIDIKDVPFSGGLPWISWPRERLQHELKTKLTRKFPDSSPAVVLAVLSRLTAEGLQSDERYTESRIRYRLERGFGYHHIRNDLINKGVDPIW